MAGQKRITLDDIARECGVSRMTVSRVLRKQRHVKAAIREKVEACAQELGYRPDPALSALIQHRRNTGSGVNKGEQLILLVPQESDYGWGDFAILKELESEIEAEAGRLGYRVKRIGLASDGSTLEPCLHKLYQQGVRGLMFAPALDISKVPAAMWHDFSVVALEVGAYNVPFHAVRNDYFQMAECAVETFYEKGCRRIGYAAGPRDLHAHHRPAGALAAQGLVHADLRTECFAVNEWTPEVPVDFLPWIERFKPDALIAIATWPQKWLQTLPAGSGELIPFAQLNRPHRDRSVHGVSIPAGVMGALIAQRIHQLLLDNECGVPKARAVLRADGYWQEADVGAYM